MSQIVLVGEDSLCCALGSRLVVHALPSWTLTTAPIDTQGVTKRIANLQRDVGIARHGSAVVCIADSDRTCPVDWLRDHLPKATPRQFVLRLAVREAESWRLADRHAMAEHFRVPTARIPNNPDFCDDSKQDLLGLLNQFAPASVRRDRLVNVAGQPRQGTGYNAGLRQFVQQAWQPERAADQSSRLRRAVLRLAELADRV